MELSIPVGNRTVDKHGHSESSFLIYILSDCFDIIRKLVDGSKIQLVIYVIDTPWNTYC